MAFSAEKTLEKIRKYGSKSYISEDRASAEERLAHQQAYYYDHEDEAKAKYQAYLQQAQAEQEARDAQKRAVQDYNYAAQYANRNGQVNMVPAGQSYAEAQYNALKSVRDPFHAMNAQYEDRTTSRPNARSIGTTQDAFNYNSQDKNFNIEDWKKTWNANLTDDQSKTLSKIYDLKSRLNSEDADVQKKQNKGSLTIPLSYYTDKAHKLGLTDEDIEKYSGEGNDLNQDHALTYSAQKMSELNEKARLAALDYVSAGNEKLSDYNSGEIQFTNEGIGTQRANAAVAHKQKQTAKDEFRKATGFDDKKADEYLDYAQRLFNYNSNQKLQENIHKDQSDGKHDLRDKILNNVQSVPESVLGGPFAAADEFSQAVKNKGSIMPVDTYTGYQSMSNAATAIRRDTADSIKSPAGKFVYNAGMSAADSAARYLPVAAIAPALAASGMSSMGVKAAANAMTLPGFGLSAYHNDLQQALESGDTMSDAQLKAISGGAIEVATELIGGEKLANIALGRMGTSATKALLSQTMAEGIEEGMGDVLNLVFQAAALGDRSDLNKKIKSYEDSGMTKKDAEIKAAKDWTADTLQDMAAGSFSGGLMGATTSANANAYGVMSAARGYKGATASDYQDIANDYSYGDDFHTEAAKKAAAKVQKQAQTLADNDGKASLGNRLSLAKAQEAVRANEQAYYAENEEQYEKDRKDYSDYINRSFLNAAYKDRIPERYQSMATDVSRDDGYTRMNTIASGNGTTEQKLNELAMVRDQMINSRSSAARQDADTDFRLFAGKIGATDDAIEKASHTAQEAYIAGLNGYKFEAGTALQQEAYNSGKIDAAKTRTGQTISSADEAREASVTIDGENRKIVGFAGNNSGNDGRVTFLKLSDGTTASLDSIKFTNNAVGTLYANASRQGTVDAQNAYIQNYQDDEQLGRYDAAFGKYYSAGALDTAEGKADFEEMYKKENETYKALFDKEQLHSIYNAGSDETSKQYIRDMQAQRKTVAMRGAGKVFIFDESRKPVEVADGDTSKEYMPFVKAVAKATKTDIYISNDLEDNINGYYDSAMQRIVLNANHEDNMINTVMHEGVGEITQAFNAEGAQKVRGVVMRYIAETSGDSYLRRTALRYQNNYTPVEATKSVSDAMGEAVNDAIAGLFSSKEGIHDFNMWMQEKEGAGKARSVLGTLSDHFKDVAESMRNLLNSGKLSKPAEDVATMAEKRASKIRKMILDELDTAIENAQNATLDENAKSSAAYSVGDYVLGQKSYTYDAKNNEFVSDDGRIIPVADKIFSVSDIKNAENIVRELVADQFSEIKGREFVIKETGEKVRISRRFSKKYTHNGFMKYAPAKDKSVKMNMSADVTDLIENATGLRHEPDKNGKHGVFAGRGWNYYNADIAVRFGDEYQVFRSELQIALNSNDNYDYVYDFAHPKKISTWSAATSENPSASLTGKPALHHMGDFSNNSVDQENNGVNAKQDYQKIEDSVPNVKRFSIDVDQPVQQTKDLIAVHNLDEEKLLADINELGGFPAPSIAIIRQGMEHNGYGDISVLFEKDTIDPERSKYNHVYGGDAWTPTFPTVEYDINDDVFYKAREKFKALKGRIPFYLYEEALRVNNNDTGNVQYSGMDSFVQKMEQNYGIRAAYVASKGIQIDDNAKRTEVGKYDDSEVKAFEAERNTLSHIGVTGEELREMPFNQVKQEYGDLILQAYQDRANTMDKKKAERFMEKAKSHYDGPVFVFRNMVDSIANALDYYKNGNPTHTEYERDENAIREKIDSNIDEKDLESWIRDTYEGLVADKGISNGADPYTPSGNRRSFRATHYALTLDNVVRAMREQQAEKGANALTETGFTAVSTKDFKNIDDIHANEDSIQSLSEEEYKSLRKNIDDKVDEIANRIKNTRSEYDLSYLTVIADAARSRHTAKGIESYLRNAGMKVYEGVGQEILDLKQEASMLPARYFEAKPMRAVGLDEIADVIAPDTVSDELKRALESNNIPYELYKAGDNADRTQKMNSHENLRFSINVDNEGNQLSSDQQNYFKDSKVRDDEGNLLVMYHGTPQGGFTKFRNGLTYFTSNPEYAQEYEGKNPQRGQQSNPQIYKVYLNITHPFDTRNAADRKLFINQYVKGGYALGIDPYSGETGLSENGLPDWNEADNIYDFLEENDLLDKYDGMVIDEAGSTRGSNGLSYVIFNPNQAKNVDNLYPTSNDDLRYSLNIDDDFDSIIDQYAEAEEGSHEDVLKEGEEALGSVHVSASDTYRLAQRLVSDYGLTGQTRALNADLQKVFAYMEKNHGNLNTGVVNGVIDDLARPYIDNITETVGSEEYDDIMSSLGEYEVRLTDKQLAEVKNAFGSLARFKSVVKGSIRINQKATTNLDQAWSSICDSVPGQLDVNTAEGDEPLAIADLIDAAQPVQQSVFDGETADEMAQDMSLSILKSYYDYATKNAVNDKVKQKAAKVSDRLKTKQTEMRAKMREWYNERLIKARKDLQKHFNDRITVTKNKDSERLAKTKAGLKEKYEGRIADIKEKDAAKLDATKKAMRDQQVIRLGELKAADLEKMAKLKARNRQKWQAAAESRRVEQERKQIDKHWSNLFNMLDEPTDNKHIPKALQGVVMDLLDSIDQDHPYIKITADGKYRLRILDHIDANGKFVYQTKDFDTRENAVMAYRAAVKMGMGSKSNRDWQMKMSRLDDLYRAAESGTENDDALNDFVRNLDPDIAQDFHAIVSKPDAVSTALLNSDELHTIDKVLRNVESAVGQYNRMITDNSEEIASIAEPIIDHSRNVRGRKDHNWLVTGALNFVSLDNATPDTFFTGMGKGGQKLYKMLLNAMDTKTHDIRQASEYMYGDGSKANGAYTGGVLAGVNLRELNSEWTGSHATVHKFESATGNEVASEGSDTVSMTTAQIMSLYELSKRQQAMLHTQGGIRVDEINGRHQDVHYLTPDAIERITSTLTKEQKSVADAMQKFMAVQAAKWGNAASNKMFGYDKFTEEHYFPITTDKTTVRTNNNSVNNEMINSIRNMGMTKQVVPGADNPIIIKDIFDVFAGHINDMATYHAYAPALQDLIRVYDYKVKGDIPGGFTQSVTVKNAIQKLYGDGGNKYMINLVKSINSAEKSNYTITNLGKLGKNYRAAAVGGNLRVVMQQPMAWFRAGMEVDYKYLNQGLLPNADADRMREETSDMCWAKSQGNVDGIVTKGFKQQITGAESTKDKLVNMSMALAGKADDVTWAALYRGVFAEQKAAFEKAGKAVLNNGEYTKAFKDAVNGRFDDMISRTQVIDGTLFRSNIMRSNDMLVQFMTSFMAEPTKTYNMFLREAINMSQNGASKEAMKRMAKAAAVFTLTQLATALAQSVADAFRRDDDDQKWYEVFLDAYMDNLRDNMNVFQLLPGVKDVWSMIENAFSDENYSSSGFYEQQSISTLIDMVQQDIKYRNNAINGENQSKTKYGIFMINMRALANFTGIPIYNMSRTAAEIYNEMNDLWGGENLYKTTKARKAHYKNVLGEAVKNNEDVEKALQDYIDAGGKASNAISKEQKDEIKQEYINAYKAGDEKTMNQIKDSTSPIFEADRKAKQEEAEEKGEKVPEDFNPDEYYDKWVTGSDEAKAAKQKVFDAIDKGGDYKKAVEGTTQYGLTYQSIESAITSQYKDKYLQMYQKDRSSVTKLKNRLEVVYSYLDQKEGQKKSGKREWLENPGKYLRKQAEEEEK